MNRTTPGDAAPAPAGAAASAVAGPGGPAAVTSPAGSSGFTSPAGSSGVTVLRGDWPFLLTRAHRWVAEEVWEDDGAAVVLLPAGERRMLVGVGSPTRLAALLAAGPLTPGGSLAPRFSAAVGHVMLTRGTWEHLSADLRAQLEPTRPWDWLVATTPPPPVPGEDRVVELEGHDRLERVYACLEDGYPERGRRTSDAALTWAGFVDDAGELRGVVGVDIPGAAERSHGAGVHLEAVTVVPAARRRGIARAMTAALTRRGLGLGAPVHLGIWADNDAARRLYASLGYEVAHRVENLRPVA